MHIYKHTLKNRNHQLYKIFYHDILIANRVRDTDTLMAEVTEEEIEEEFQYCFKKYGLSR